MATRKAPARKKETAPAKEAAAEESAAPAVDNVDLLDDLPVTFSVELGRTQQTLETAISLGEQSLIELDKQMGDPVDIKLNGKLFARGEVVTVGENFGVRITEILGKA